MYGWVGVRVCVTHMCSRSPSPSHAQCTHHACDTHNAPKRGITCGCWHELHTHHVFHPTRDTPLVWEYEWERERERDTHTHTHTERHRQRDREREKERKREKKEIERFLQCALHIFPSQPRQERWGASHTRWIWDSLSSSPCMLERNHKIYLFDNNTAANIKEMNLIEWIVTWKSTAMKYYLSAVKSYCKKNTSPLWRLTLTQIKQETQSN